MVAERRRDVSRCGHMPHENKQSQRNDGSGGRNSAEYIGPPSYPAPSRSHRGTKKQSQRRIARHRVILLSRRKREKDQQKTRPAKRHQPHPPGAVHRFKRKLGDRWKVKAPGEKPQEMEQPKIKPRNGIVIAWIPEIQKT